MNSFEEYFYHYISLSMISSSALCPPSPENQSHSFGQFPRRRTTSFLNVGPVLSPPLSRSDGV